MDGSMALPLIMRWIHILSAIIVVGGLVFYRLVLVPAARATLDESNRDQLRDAIMKRWKMFVHASVLLFLLSGFYNYIGVTSDQHAGQTLYAALFGIKFLVAIVVFAGIIVISSTMPWSKNLRDSGAMWTLLLVASLAVILIAGYMKVMPAAGQAEPAPAVEEAPPAE